MESTGKKRLRECQIEQERRYERARRDLEDEQRRAKYIGRFYTMRTDTTGMKKIGNGELSLTRRKKYF